MEEAGPKRIVGYGLDGLVEKLLEYLGYIPKPGLKVKVGGGGVAITWSSGLPAPVPFGWTAEIGEPDFLNPINSDAERKRIEDMVRKALSP